MLISTSRRCLCRCLWLILLAGLAQAVWAQSPQPLRPKQAFPSDFLNVYSPDAEGWVLAGMGQNGIAFGKLGPEKFDTIAAQVAIFELAATKDADDFVALIKQRIAAKNPESRYKPVSLRVVHQAQRGYPCADVQSVYEDTGAVTREGVQTLMLQVEARYCRHPVHTKLGFMVAYSHRGKKLDPAMAAPAKSFIDAVVVPGK